MIVYFKLEITILRVAEEQKMCERICTSIVTVKLSVHSRKQY